MPRWLNSGVNKNVLAFGLGFLGGFGFLFVTGVLDAKEAFSDFSSTSVIVIGVLFVVVAGLMHTGVLQWIVKHLLGLPRTYPGAVARQGRRLEQSPHEVRLHAGDTLLFECPRRMKINTAHLSSQLRFFDSEQVPNIGPKTLVSTIIMIAMVVLSALKVLPLLQCAFLATAAMLLCR